MGIRPLFTTIASILLVTCCAQAAAGDEKLEPGKTIEFEIPGPPPSLADLIRKTNAKTTRMAVKLPDSYEAGRSYPVLVFLSGGDGGNGGELHQATPFLGGTDYILCNIPLFKQDIESEDMDRKLSVTPLDGPYALPALKMLFNELHRLIPNIDDSRSVIGGFSNGANTVGLILWAGDRDLLARFSAFVLVEGGFWLGADGIADWPDVKFRKSTLSGLEKKRVLVMYGDLTQPADRVPWIKSARESSAALRQAGVETAEMPMADTGHDFPAAAMAKARQWVLSGK